VLSEVVLSVEELPESEVVSRSGVAGVLGAVVSTTIALLAPSDPDAVGVGKVKAASTLDEFLIVPPFSPSGLVVM
jgi:hypothetical protein